MTRRAAVYVRISQDREGAGLGVDRQRQDCENLAATLGWTITSVHVDNDVSAYSGKKRPGYLMLLDELKSGAVDAVLVWHTDRLHRSTVELEEYIAICEPRGIPTQTVQAGPLDLATPSGRMVARMLGAAARYEVEHKSARTKRSQAQAAAAGKWLGGARPIGWRIHDDGSAELHPQEAAEISSAIDRILAGESIGSIVRDLNARGFTTGRGGKWNHTSFRQVISRPRNAGIVTLNDVEVGRSPWPTIVDEETHRAVVALLETPGRRTHDSNVARYLLAGLALCGREGCRRRMKSASTRSGAARKLVRMYRCPPPSGELGHASRRVEPLDDYVEEMVAEYLARPEFRGIARRPAAGVDMKKLNIEAERLRRRKAEAEEMFAAGEIERPALKSITAAVSESLIVVNAQIASGASGGPLDELVTAASPPQLWRSWTIQRKRRALPYLVTIVVLPGGRGGHKFRPELIVPEWVDQQM